MSLFYSYIAGRFSTCFGPTGPSSGEFVQLFTQPLVQFLCRSVRVLCMLPVGPKHVEIQQYTNKIVTSVGFHSICYTVYLYLETALHVSGGTSTHRQERIQLYLQHLVFVTPLLLSAAIVEELEPV